MGVFLLHLQYSHPGFETQDFPAYRLRMNLISLAGFNRYVLIGVRMGASPRGKRSFLKNRLHPPGMADGVGF
ncbi:MAG: hypothetical protein CMJ23_13330 [Phycisphaerae bacterium]|nr:hypothetical protein [Phycisphaerae bacterium]